MFGGGGSIQLARVFGIRVGASPSWFVVLFVTILLLSQSYQDGAVFDPTTAYVLAVIAAGLVFLSILLHELGHAFAARREGIQVLGVDLWFFGGVAKLSRDARTPGEEARVAAAGPFVTLLVLAASVGVAAASAGGASVWEAIRLNVGSDDPVFAVSTWLASVNAFLLLFNLVPAFPLDGGRLARAAAWRLTGDRSKATLVSAQLGRVFGYGLVAYGVFMAFGDDPTGGVLWIVLGYFLASAAKSAIATSAFQERLEGIAAGDLMDPSPVTLPAPTPVAEAADAWFDRYRWPWFAVVDEDGRFQGILTRERVDGAMEAGRPALPVGELLDPGDVPALSIARQAPLEDLLGSEALARLGALMVVEDDGRLAGVVTIEQVRRALVAAAPGRA